MYVFSNKGSKKVRERTFPKLLFSVRRLFTPLRVHQMFIGTFCLFHFSGFFQEKTGCQRTNDLVDQGGPDNDSHDH